MKIMLYCNGCGSFKGNIHLLILCEESMSVSDIVCFNIQDTGSITGAVSDGPWLQLQWFDFEESVSIYLIYLEWNRTSKLAKGS